MNLLEINATKLFEILNTDADKGLKSVDVEKNRKEFSSSVRSSKSLPSVIRSIFGDVMPLLFVFTFIGGAITALLMLACLLAGALQKLTRGDETDETQ